MFNLATIIFGVVFLCMIIGTLSAFYWAAKTGQMDNLVDGSTVIFDDEEKIGVVTDVFPDRQWLPKKGVTIVRSLERKKI